MTILNFIPRSNLPANHVSSLMESRGIAHPRPQPSPDALLVGRTLAGERPAFDELILKYQRQAVAVSYRLLGNTHDALEVTQDAFIKAFTKLHKLEKPDAFAGWLMRIVANLSLNFRRGRKNRGQLPLDDVMGSAESSKTTSLAGSEWTANGFDPLRRLQSAEMGRKLAEALRTLPEKQRVALAMFTVDELPQKQIAAALGCSVEAVKWHVFQGRKRLRELLKDHL